MWKTIVPVVSAICYHCVSLKSPSASSSFSSMAHSPAGGAGSLPDPSPASSNLLLITLHARANTSLRRRHVIFRSRILICWRTAVAWKKRVTAKLSMCVVEETSMCCSSTPNAYDAPETRYALPRRVFKLDQRKRLYASLLLDQIFEIFTLFWVRISNSHIQSCTHIHFKYLG